MTIRWFFTFLSLVAAAIGAVPVVTAQSPESGDSGQDDVALSGPVVVTPFLNVSQQAVNAWLGYGIAESVAGDLMARDGVEVVSRNRIQAAIQEDHEGLLRNESEAVALGRGLDSDWVITGDYQRLEGQLGITARLIDARTGASRRSVEIDGPVEEMFELGDYIARALAGAREASSPSPRAQLIGPQDVMTITVYGEDDLSGQYTVEDSGTISFPLIGRIVAQGRTRRGLEEHIRERLADGFYREPLQVAVEMDQYRSQRIFVMGEVRQSGTFPLTGDMTAIEVLARVGMTEAASHEVVIVRSDEDRDRPVLPGEEDASEVLTIDLEAIRGGDLSGNLRLRGGDTIFVGRESEGQLVYFYGEVARPGVVPLNRGMTLLQGLSLAGGLTPYGASGRIKILRMVDGEQKEFEGEMPQLLEPGDTVVVPRRYF